MHHQGRGHATHVKLLTERLTRPSWVFTSRPDYFDDDCAATVVQLPMDLPTADECYPQHLSPVGESLHYAPLQVKGVQDRMAILAQWIQRHRPALMFVDLSAEVAALCRLMSVPTVVVRLQGWRDDPAHLATFENARAIFCPYPQAFEWSRLSGDLEQKCYYEGCYDRLGAREHKAAEPPGDAGEPAPPPTDADLTSTSPEANHAEADLPPARADFERIVVLVGSGGTQFTAERLHVLAEAVPQARVEVLGPIKEQGSRTGNLFFLGERDYVLPYLQRADLIVGGAGTNVVTEVGACNKRFVCLPEDRAFGEQHAKAKGLERLGLAVRLKQWPSAEEWVGVLAKAAELDPRAWDQYFYDPTLADAAACLERLAAESEETCKPADQKPVPSFL